MAAKAVKVRLVRCPKCWKVLTELTDIPVYKCGECGTVLQAKYHSSSMGSTTSEAVEKNPAQKDKLEHDSDGKESISSSNQEIYCSTDSYALDLNNQTAQVETGDCNKKESESRSSDVISSSNELDCHGNEESFNAGENGEVEESRRSDVISSLHELDCHGKEQLFNAGENGEAEESEGRGSKFGSPVTYQLLSEQNIQVKTDIDSLAVYVEEPQELGQHDTDIRSKDKMEVTEESVNHCVNLEEDMVKTNLLESPTTRSSHAYYGSVSSLEDSNDYHVPSRHLHTSKRTSCKPPRVSESTKGRPTRDDILRNNKMSTASEVLTRKFSSVSSNEKHNMVSTDSVNWNQGESSKPNRYEIYAEEQGNFHNSEGFRSVLKWMESERDGPSKFQSRDMRYRRESPSVYQNGSSSNYRHKGLLQRPNLHASDNLELLRKVDELRDQLSRTYDQRGKSNGRFPIRSTQQGNQWPLHYDHEPEHEFSQFYSGNYARHPPGLYRPRKVGPPQCSGFLQIPYSGQTTNYQRHVDYSCLCSYPEDWQLPMQGPPSVCYNKGLCTAHPGHTNYHPYSPSPSSSAQSADSCYPPSGRTAQPHEQRLTDYEVEKFYYKEKHQMVKRHCRPIAGGAPFIICCNCLKSLQLPADFLLLKKKCHKLRCGSCTEILIFSLRNGTHILPYNSSHTQVDSSLASTSHANEGEPTSFSEEYGLSTCKSYSTEGEPALFSPKTPILQRNAIDRKHSSDSSPDVMKGSPKSIPELSGNKSANARVVAGSEKSSSEAKVPPPIGSPLHQLMGYSSPSELIYQSTFEDEGSENTDIQTPRQSCIGSKENGMLSPRHKDSGSGTCRDNKEVCKEDGLSKRSRNTRNASLTGSINKEQRELSKGLENMRLNVHVNGRVIPDQLLKKSEEKAGPIEPGNYWYDSRAGFWGVMGQPCLGLLPPFIKAFNHPMKRDCSGGDTGILVNGRELHQKDLEMLSMKGLPTTKNKAYRIDSNGKVIDEATGEELESLGMLAPTIEKAGVGFGMLVPPSAAID